MNFPPNSFYNFVLFSPTFANDQINPFHFQIYFLIILIILNSIILTFKFKKSKI